MLVGFRLAGASLRIAVTGLLVGLAERSHAERRILFHVKAHQQDRSKCRSGSRAAARLSREQFTE